MKSNCVPHRPETLSPHELTTNTTNTTKPLPVSAGTVLLCLPIQQISSYRALSGAFNETRFALTVKMPLYSPS